MVMKNLWIQKISRISTMLIFNFYYFFNNSYKIEYITLTTIEFPA